MYTDVVDLREFYLTPLGHAVRRIIQMRLRYIWPNLRGERMLTLGYGVPFIRPFLAETDGLYAFMPAAQGVAYWPREGPNISCLVETDRLPLADQSVDRIILIHALEGDPAPHNMLRETWRVLKNGGRMLLIVPNRRGLWAHSDRTPFGTGQPYSAFQIKDTLRDHGFLADRSWQSLYMPPSSSRLMLSLVDVFEKYGAKLFPGFGGLLLIEAGKQLFGPAAIQTKSQTRRMVVPLPMPTPFPAS